MTEVGSNLATPNSQAGETALRSRMAFSYCAACGSWDAHELACATCGFDFGAPAEPAAERERVFPA